MTLGRGITATEYDAIIAALQPAVHGVMRRYSLAATTVGKMAVKAGQMPVGGQG